jgi:hypothetical protein
MSVLFPLGREGILDTTIDMTGDVRVMLVLDAYVYDAADKFLVDLGAVDNGRTATLAGHNYALGTFNATNTTVTATAALACNALILFQETGADATARLIAYIDTATGLPFTPAVGQVCPIIWDVGADKIFTL